MAPPCVVYNRGRRLKPGINECQGSEEMSVTLFDVAKEAGVSKSTVSLVINNSDAVKPETRERVYAAINKLNYTPNVSAQELTTKKKQVLGSIFLTKNLSEGTYLFDSVTETFFYDTLTGISSELSKTNYGLISERFSRNEQTGDLPLIVKNNRVAGLFIIGGLISNELIEIILQKKLPAVIIGSQHPLIDSVNVDIFKAACIAVKYLTDLGHRKIAFINGPVESSTTDIKLKGYCKALKDAGIEIDGRLITNAEFTGLSGYIAMKKLWESGVKMTAVFCASDSIAAGAMRYLYDAGIRIPDVISVIGYEHSIISEHVIPALTTVQICKEQMGVKACKLLLNRIKNPEDGIKNQILKPKLIIRDSVRRI